MISLRRLSSHFAACVFVDISPACLLSFSEGQQRAEISPFVPVKSHFGRAGQITGFHFFVGIRFVCGPILNKKNCFSFH
jgi:hypothetical protein